VALACRAFGLSVMGRFCPFTNVDFEGEYHEPVKALRR